MIEYLIAHIGHTMKCYEHVCWWKPDSRGYTICVEQAGRYDEAEALSICTRTGLCIAVPVDAVTNLVRTTPYYRLPDGSLAKMYDGEKHSPVPNGHEEWQALIATRLDTGEHDKPTPIGKKSRAIYLPKQEGGAYAQ
ncbi:hypothetical protein A9J41_12955 [Laribacter hongkongensis]|uniref:hypothetical protein n=1 Tax=Laribacter hongkongensis TaxID=168471 RepID=UPI001878588C|nr:hypothetical protein [Laribacter hongkongensis]MBE5528412.1 hypothetical protein [Laribacter hongkongensis]